MTFHAREPEDLQTDQAMRHLMGGSARSVAGEAGQYSERPPDNPGAKWLLVKSIDQPDETTSRNGG